MSACLDNQDWQSDSKPPIGEKNWEGAARQQHLHLHVSAIFFTHSPQKKLPKRSSANWSCHAWPFSITLMSEEGIRREWSCPGCQPQDTVGLYCRAEPWRWGRLEAESTLAASLPRNRRVRLAWFGLVKCKDTPFRFDITIKNFTRV